MARPARAQSETGMYHVMMRGINHQQIFEDDEDCYVMLQTLQNVQQQYADNGERLPDSCTYYAYALMGNHFHLLVHVKELEIGDMVKKIAGSYVYYYNRKYGRDGHLFKERFKSEPCNDMKYFITLLRYIHQNPVKAGIVRDVKDYEFTSWREYLKDESVVFPICNVAAVFKRISMEELTTLVYTILPNDVCCVEYESARARSLSDDQLLLNMKEQYGILDASHLQQLAIRDRDVILMKLLNLGAGVRQLNRLTGIGKNIISKLNTDSAAQ